MLLSPDHIGLSEVSGGGLVTQTAEEWAKGFPGKPADDEDQRKRSYEIVDVTDNAAIVKLLLDFPAGRGWTTLRCRRSRSSG